MTGGSDRTVAFFCPAEAGHFARMRPLIAGAVAEGWRAVVFTDARFRDAIEGHGGVFHDLYGHYPIEAADDESIPRSIRHVTYTAKFAEDVVAELRGVDASLVVYDGFALVAPVAARLLDLPYVCVCPGHNLCADQIRSSLGRDMAITVSARCEDALPVLRERYGIDDANPFSYLSTKSPHLNLYCEPDEYLDHERREAFDPLACIGSVLPSQPRPSTSFFGRGSDGLRKIYVSFGTVVWRAFTNDAIRALDTITRTLSARGDTRVLVSLGGHTGPVPDLAASPGVRVAEYVDQWSVLAEADVFITHHGLNSTHEAAYQGVPMLSYPFFWDQPALAAKCAELGIAEPLTTHPRSALTSDDVAGALARLDADPDRRRSRLAEAMAYERRVIAERPDVIRRMLGLARPS